MSQPSLITTAKDSDVILPSNEDQWRLIRDTAAAGSGNYHAYNKDGVKESFGGSASNYSLSTGSVSQSLTEAPTIKWGINNLGEVPALNYLAVGIYTIVTQAPVFTSDKTFLFTGINKRYVLMSLYSTTPYMIYINSFDLFTGQWVLSDSVLEDITFQIIITP